MHGTIVGERPARPSEPDEWVSDDVWNIISRCWGPSRVNRPDVGYIMNALNDAADAVEARRGEVPNDQEKRTSRPVPGTPHVYHIPVMS